MIPLDGCTGDLAAIDDDGYCSIVGRIKDKVIRGGENVYPREMEEFLYRHEHNKDVQIVGVPDARFGEELCAQIVDEMLTTVTGKVQRFAIRAAMVVELERMAGSSAAKSQDASAAPEDGDARGPRAASPQSNERGGGGGVSSIC